MNIYHTPCVITVDLKHYLAQVDKEDLWQEALESRQKALLAEGGDYHPFLIDNLLEAIGEIDITAIAASLKVSKYEEAGKVLANLVNAYWEHKAQQKAEREIKENICPRCHAWGCYCCGED